MFSKTSRAGNTELPPQELDIPEQDLTSLDIPDLTELDVPDITDLELPDITDLLKTSEHREALASCIDAYTAASNELEVCNALLAVMQCCDVEHMPNLLTAKQAINAQVLEASERQDNYLNAINERMM